MFAFKAFRTLALPFKGSYNFARLMSKKEARMMKPVMPKEINNDDLYFPHHLEQFNGGIEKLCRTIKTTGSDLVLDRKGISVVIYNCGLKNISDSRVFKEIEGHLYKFKGNFTHRLSFGCLYGCFKTNAATPYMIGFFEREYLKTIKETTPAELLQMIEALSCNTSNEREFLHNYINEHFKSMLLENLNSFYKHNPRCVYKLYNYLLKLEYFDKEVFEIILKYIVRRKFAGNFEMIVRLYETLFELEKSKKLYRSVQPEIETLKNILKNDIDFSWRYSVDERRYFTYWELKDRREDYPRTRFEDKYISISRDSEKDLKEFLENYTSKEDLEFEERAKANVAELEKLVYDKFVLQKLGEDTESEIEMMKEMEDGKFKALLSVREEEPVSKEEPLTKEEELEVEKEVEEQMKDMQSKAKLLQSLKESVGDEGAEKEEKKAADDKKKKKPEEKKKK